MLKLINKIADALRMPYDPDPRRRAAVIRFLASRPGLSNEEWHRRFGCGYANPARSLMPPNVKVLMAAPMRTLWIIALCVQTAGAEESKTLGFVHPELKEWTKEQERRENYEALRAWHATPEFFDAGHPRERRADLNGDGRPEVFLLYAGHSYWGGYSGFTQRGKTWVFIGQFRLGGRKPVLLKKRRQGWSDFTVDTDASRGRLNRDIYKWDAEEGIYSEGKLLKVVRPASEVNHEP